MAEIGRWPWAKEMNFRTVARKSRLVVIGFALPVASVAMFWIIPFIGLAGTILSFLLLVARYDNDLGTFLPIATLFVIVILIMVLLVGALAYVHALISGMR